MTNNTNGQPVNTGEVSVDEKPEGPSVRVMAWIFGLLAVAFFTWISINQGKPWILMLMSIGLFLYGGSRVVVALALLPKVDDVRPAPYSRLHVFVLGLLLISVAVILWVINALATAS